MSKGVIFISVKKGTREDPYRTGGWCVIKDDGVRRMPIEESLEKEILKERVCFIEDEVYDGFGLPRG